MNPRSHALLVGALSLGTLICLCTAWALRLTQLPAEARISLSPAKLPTIAKPPDLSVPAPPPAAQATSKNAPEAQTADRAYTVLEKLKGKKRTGPASLDLELELKRIQAERVVRSDYRALLSCWHLDATSYEEVVTLLVERDLLMSDAKMVSQRSDVPLRDALEAVRPLYIENENALGQVLPAQQFEELQEFRAHYLGSQRQFRIVFAEVERVGGELTPQQHVGLVKLLADQVTDRGALDANVQAQVLDEIYSQASAFLGKDQFEAFRRIMEAQRELDERATRLMAPYRPLPRPDPRS